jgi:hypothetical protein
VLCHASTHDGNAWPKTKQPVHRSDLTFHYLQLELVRWFQLEPMQIAVRRWFQLEPMQIAVPLPCYVGPTTALTAAALPPLTANCNHKW